MKPVEIAVLVFAFINISVAYGPYRAVIPTYNYQYNNDGRYYDYSNSRYKSLAERNGKYSFYNPYQPPNLKAPEQQLLTPLVDSNDRFVHNSLVPVTYRPPSITVPTFRPIVYSTTPKPVELPPRPANVRIQYNNDKDANIITQDNDADGNGYNYSYQTDNGISAGESGLVESTGSGGGTRVRGFYEYVGTDGLKYRVDYTADENGFRPVGAHILSA